jgi:hypothetical protein
MYIKVAIIVAIVVVLLISCRKKNDNPTANLASLSGKWQSGPFNIIDFWQPQQWNPSAPPSLTRAFHFDGPQLEVFHVAFPSGDDPCSLQAFLYMKGKAVINTGDKSFTFYPEEGHVRAMRKNCADPDINRNLTLTELGTPVKYFYTITQRNGSHYLALRNAMDTAIIYQLEKVI